MRRLRELRGAKGILSALAVLCWTVTASAQLDPLTILRRVPPTVIVVFDTSLEMLTDGTNNFYDPGFYSSTADPTVMNAFITASPPIGSAKTYRRVFRNFHYAASPNKYTADRIAPVAASWDPSNSLTSNAVADTTTYFANTRWQIARNGLAQALTESNSTTARWGLLRLRQKNPAWRSTPGGTSTGGNDCDKPVGIIADPTQSLYGDTTPCNAGGFGKYATYAPVVGSGGASDAGYTQSSAPSGTVVVTPGANNVNAMYNVVAAQAGNPSALIPASVGGKSGTTEFADRPLSYALDDAKAAVVSAMASDAASTRTCRNYVIVLVTGGQDSGDSTYLSANNAATRASQFLTISSASTTRSVPIHVVGIKVKASEEAQLQSIATNSRGTYHNVTTEAEVTRWINYAVQAGYARQADIDTGNPSEYVTVSPIVGTVNLTGGQDSTGTALPNDVVHIGGLSSNAVVPQRSNVLLSAGFELPGFSGRLRAFRAYKPVADSSKSSGYKFVNDGTKLWPDLDGRTTLAGQARTPLSASSRNIYTFVPNGTGGGSIVAFTTANASTLASPMNLTTAAASTLIDFVRQQPLGAPIGSTPALMDPPSLDPPPDNDYGRTGTTGTFAGDHEDRRSIIFVGMNDGMMHAIDARTGYEVWAFIPYNLLPKLRTLYDGQSVEQFEYFVDSSPKLAEVKINGAWRSLLLFGQGPGGIFYQCFDVTEAGMGVAPDKDTLSDVNNLLQRFDSPDESIVFKWAFPNYGHFDPAIKQTFTLNDGSPGNKLVLWGDLKSTATYAEKSVGFTWSDPAVGPLISTRAVNGVIVGSGYFPDIESAITNRGATGPKAGTTMFLLDADTGVLLGNSTGASCGTVSGTSGSGTGCLSVGDVSNGRKNALQADPTAAGDYGSPVVNKAYFGDIDGKYWRFNFDSTGALSANLMVDTGVPIYASSALLFVGSTDVYMFFATGSDSLPTSTTGGTGTFKLYGLKDNAPGSGATTKFSLSLSSVTQSGGLASGERPSTSPTVAGDIVFYTTTTEVATTPCVDFTANLYAVTYAGSAAYDANNNGRLDNNESNIVRTATGRATAPFIVDQHLYFATSAGSGGAGSGNGGSSGDRTGAKIEAFGDPEDFNNGVGQVGVRILSWREIR
jgi:hypothetical protein